MDEREIILLYPGERIAKPRLPMSVLTLAGYCIAKGYKCKIIDERVTELKDGDINAAKIIGISTMSGFQLNSAVKTAERIKKLRPDVPLIWGGAHPSAYPQQTAQSPLVDVVVKGEGEEIFLKLCEKILAGSDFSELPAIVFKKNDELVDNPVLNDFIQPDELPFPMYELVDIGKYADFENGLSYETSRGCPYRCTFCYVEYFHKRKWRGKSVDRVINEMRRISDDIGVRKLFIIDDNFFANKKRSLEICSKMVSEGIWLNWTATARADFVSRCSDEEMRLIRKSNCEILSIGAESGSETVLKKIQKDITTEQIKTAVKKCVDNGIMPAVSFVIGLPFEEDADLDKTLDLYDELMKFGKNVEINGLFVYVPYAGTPLFQTAVEYGYKPKSDLVEWGQWNFSDISNNPWLTRKRAKRLEAVSNIARFKFMYHRFEYYSGGYKQEKLKSLPLRIGYFLFVRLFAFFADLRWKHRFFSFAVEWTLWQKLTYKLFKVR